MKRGFHSQSKDLLVLYEGSASKSLYIGDSAAFILALRTVPTFATAHPFCASCDGPRKSGFLTVVPAKTEIFVQEKQILARPIEIRKEN